MNNFVYIKRFWMTKITIIKDKGKGKIGKNIFNSYNKGLISVIQKSFYKSMKRRPTIQWQKGRVHKEFTEKEIQKAFKCMKKCST